MAYLIAAVLGIPILLALAYAGVVAYLAYNQRKLIFNTEMDDGVLPSISESGLDNTFVEDRVLVAPGVRTTVWSRFVSATWKDTGWQHARARYPIILYIMGAGGSLARRVDRFKAIAYSGCGLYAIVPRGYAGSDGRPGEKAFIADAVKHYDRIKTLNPTGQKIVVYGESMGASVAVALAARRKCDAVVLESPFKSLIELVSEKYPWLIGLRWVLRDHFKTDKIIRQLDEPLMIVHGGKDEITPVEHGKHLYGIAKEPKHFVELPDAGHFDLWSVGEKGNDLWRHVLHWFKEMNFVSHIAEPELYKGRYTYLDKGRLPDIGKL